MKKILLILAVFFGIGQAYAENKLVVGETTIPKGLTGTIDIELQNDVEFTAFTMKLTLPEGLSFVLDEYDKASFEKGSRFADHGLSASGVTNNSAIFACLSNNSLAIKGTSGTLFSVYVKSDASMEIGTKLAATITEPTFTTPGEVEYNLSAVNIPVTIGEPRTLLDENSTTIPEASSGAVDVRVKRTINANSWSTICLPFAMDEAQVKAAFGDDVLLGDFQDYDTTEDGDNIIGITVNFTSATTIEANHPYIIKVINAITEFTVDDVDINADEEDAYVEYNNGLTGKKKVVYGTFEGTLHAGKTLTENQLFLNSNKFWYSKGSTTINAFRAYFDLTDVLTSVENASVRMSVDIDGEETSVEGISASVPEGAIYDLSGRKLNNVPQKGIYIVNGKKVMK